jgi:hypothetical protein
MSSVNDQNNAQEKQLSPEETLELRTKMLNYYKTQLPVLEIQKVVENLSADIEEARLRRIVAAVRQAQLMAGPKDEEESDEPEPETHDKPARKLKTE